MKNKMVNPNSITDADLMNAKNQASMAALMQKIGKGNRKYTVKLSKPSQKYLEQVVEEQKKQMKIYEKQMPNVFSFFNYVQKNLHVEKGQKRPNEKNLSLSFEEKDLLVRQMREAIKAMEKEKTKLKWYNLIKKTVYTTMIKQAQALLDELK